MTMRFAPDGSVSISETAEDVEAAMRMDNPDDIEPWECPACSGDGCRLCSGTGLTGRDAQYIADMRDAFGGLP